MIDRHHDLSITRLAEVLTINRGSVDCLPHPVCANDLAIMRRLDRLNLEFPFAGLRGLLAAEGCQIGRPQLAFTSFVPHGGATDARTSGLTETQVMRKRQWSSAEAMAHDLLYDDEAKQVAQINRMKHRKRAAKNERLSQRICRTCRNRNARIR